jgi:hypothetical protein
MSTHVFVAAHGAERSKSGKALPRKSGRTPPHQVWCAALSERSRVSILLTQPLERPFPGPVSIPIPRQEWADAVSAIIAPDEVHSARIRHHDANGLVDWLFDLLGPPGAANDKAEQNTRRGLESTVADEISWAEIDIAV